MDSEGKGILISAQGDLNELAWTDAGFAGTETKSQSGLIIRWGGNIIVWRSSRQTGSTLSTAEAELVAATLGWQHVEGLRYLLLGFGIGIPRIEIMVDKQAALTIANCGANWRTQYFAVRRHRLHEEYLQGRAGLEHCPTKEMLADTLTKIATPPMILVIHDAMNGIQATHKTSVSPPVGKTGAMKLVMDLRVDNPSIILHHLLPVDRTGMMKQVMDLREPLLSIEF